MRPMNNEPVKVWECEHEIEVNAGPEVVWRIFQNLAEWPKWNAGIARIEVDGPFVAGTRFRMTLPDGPELTTRLVEVRENVGFVDETRLEDLRVFVDHQIQPLPAGRSRVKYSLEAFGPSCDEMGPIISADFPEVLKALAALAEEQAEHVECKLSECGG